MNNETKIPELDLNIETVTVSSRIMKKKMTRRSIFYHGILGRIKCFYYWIRFFEEKRKISFGKWLDEPIAYSIEPSFDIHYHPDVFKKEIEKEFEHYLVNEIPREKK